MEVPKDSDGCAMPLALLLSLQAYHSMSPRFEMPLTLLLSLQAHYSMSPQFEMPLTLLLSSQAHYNMSPQFEMAINYTNIIVTAIFVVELVLK